VGYRGALSASDGHYYIVCMECSQILSLFGMNLKYYQRFWQVIIVFHLLQLFKGRRVNGINFIELDLSSILECYYKPDVSVLGKWIKGVLSLPVGSACKELVQITKKAFNSDSDEKPVFLLDNIHCQCLQPEH